MIAMNDEIKEKKTKRIIEKIEGLATYVTIPRELAIYNVNIDSQEAKLLIDYITNLQQENERLKELCDKYEEEHSTAFNLWKMKMEEMPTYEEKEDYKSRIEKAVEYIENNSLYDEILDYDYEENPYISYTTDEYVKDNLLNILNGKE